MTDTWIVPASDPSDPSHVITLDGGLDGPTLNLTLTPSCGVPVMLTPREARNLATALTDAADQAERFRRLP